MGTAGAVKKVENHLGNNFLVIYADNLLSFDIKKFITKPTYMAWGDAVLKVDDKDKAIYFAKYVQVGLFEKLVWDSGMDPALDPF